MGTIFLKRLAVAALVALGLGGAAAAEPWAIFRNCDTDPCAIGVAIPGSIIPGYSEVATFSGPQEAWSVACAFHYNDPGLYAPDVENGAVDCGALSASANGMIAISSESWSIFRNCNTRPCTIGVALPSYSAPGFSRIATYGSAAQAWFEACQLHYNDSSYSSPDIASGLIDCALLDAGTGALLGPWVFGRVDGPFLCNITLTGARGTYGYVIQSCHDNETFWRLNGSELYFYRSDGLTTTIFRRQAEDHWTGPYLGDPAAGIVHYIRRADPGAGPICPEGYNPYGCN